MITLTKSQSDVLYKINMLLPYYSILTIKGDVLSGKYTILQKLIETTNCSVVNFDLTSLPVVSNEVIYDYLVSLERKLENDKYGFIIIRNFGRVCDILSDSNFPLRNMFPLIIKTFAERLSANVKILICGHGCMMPEGLHWYIDLHTTREDMQFVLRDYPDSVVSDIMKLSKVLPVGRLLQCIKYAKAHEAEGNFIEFYKEALSRFSGVQPLIDQDIPKPINNEELIGLDSLLEEIKISIINPMNCGVNIIPIKKGMIICGPPGTGKTSIGRWLAHQIKGKFYLMNGTEGTNVIDIFSSLLLSAKANAPAVIFIDDCDVLFKHDDIYRSFLTLLDGIESNKRADICIIVTCMNLKNIPSCLIRGGRLELVLITSLPDITLRNMIFSSALNKMVRSLYEYNPEIGLMIENQINDELINFLCLHTSDWNCADIQRSVNDALRNIIYGNKNLQMVFRKTFRTLSQQYEFCSRTESTNAESFSYGYYS